VRDERKVGAVAHLVEDGDKDYEAHDNGDLDDVSNIATHIGQLVRRTRRRMATLYLLLYIDTHTQ
jgi:hypothetical protein